MDDFAEVKAYTPKADAERAMQLRRHLALVSNKRDTAFVAAAIPKRSSARAWVQKARST